MKIDNNLAIAAVVAVAVVAAMGVGYIMSENGKDYGAMATELVNDFNEGEYEKCWEQLDDDVKALITVEALKESWESATEALGPMTGILDVKVTKGDMVVCEVITAFGDQYMKIIVIYNQSDKIVGLTMTGHTPSDLPDGLIEEDVVVGEGTRWALNGKIVTSDDGVRSKAAAVIVQGSGPSNMDEAIYANTPLRDVAWSLGVEGVDTIRYDKRTFVYGSEIVNMKDFTVEGETIEDAILAGEILRDLGYQEIYLIGHSLGGMMAPRIVSESDGLFDGFVSLAGSPRTLTDIITDQSQAAIDEIADPQMKAAQQALLDAETLKVPMLDVWTDEEAQDNIVFGVSAYYLKEMRMHDTAAIVKSLDCPMLFLQGSEDFQVYADRDYVAWQTVLDGYEGATFQLFPGLNHLFMVSKDPGKGTIDEYKNPSHVEQDVIDAMAAFILNA